MIDEVQRAPELLSYVQEAVDRDPDAGGSNGRLVWTGGYPRIYDRKLPADEWLSSYASTYVERDVRQLVNVGDLLAFQTFVRLCAGRVGQLVNLSALGADAGITHMTARAWRTSAPRGRRYSRLACP